MKDFAKSIRTNNTKVENSSKFDALDSIIQEASMYAQNAYRRLNSPYSATNIISDLSHCKQACDIGIKRAQEYDKELQDKERKGRTGNAKVGNARTDIIYKGRALTDEEIRKLTPSQKSEIMREYERMVRSGAISDSEMAEAMDEIKYFGRTGNAKVGNMDAFLSNAEIFAKEWIKEVDKAAKEENVNKLTGLLNSAEAKIKELEKFGEEKFAEYKKASELVPKFREIAFYAKSDIGLLKLK